MLSINKIISLLIYNTFSKKNFASIIFASLIVPLSIVSSTLHAEQSSIRIDLQELTNDESKYPASFFAQYVPQNSLEMIERLPGFKFDQGQNNRGFGGNAGNVLVDGARPTSKSGGLSGALIRIPAAQVEYIEILRNGVSASETSGHAIIANIVRKKEVTSGTWAAKIRRAPDGKMIPNIEAAINTNISDWSTALDIDVGGFPGYRTALIEKRDTNGDLDTASDEVFVHRNKWLFTNAEAATSLAGGLLTINTRLGADNGEFDTRRDIFLGRQPTHEEPDQRLTIVEENEFRIGEVGIDWNKTQNDWKVHLIGLFNNNKDKYQNEVLFSDFTELTQSTSTFSQDSEKTESIARGTYGYSGKNKFKPEVGIEVAKNELSSKTEHSGSIENVDVDEIRSEIFANFTYQFSKDFTVKGGLTGEFSQIEVTGASENKQSFKFLKPNISANYKINQSHQLALLAERNVGQLNFRDFAASNDVADESLFSGNPNLAPDTSDELSVTYDWSFSEKGSFKIELFHHWKQDILEQIILSNEGEEQQQGLGNAGDAKFWGINTDLSLPLDWFLENGLIEVSHVYADSRFDDSVIDAERTINGYTNNWLSFELRQDIVESKIAWGVEYWGNFIDTNFRVNERVTFRGNDRFRVFIETSKYLGVKIQLEITHINTGEYTRSRFIHGGNRRLPFDRSEIAYRKREPEIKLSVSGTF